MKGSSAFPLYPSDGSPRWSPEISDQYAIESAGPGVHQIGVLPGEGIGPEVIDAALTVLSAVETVSQASFDLRYGGCIGLESQSKFGCPLAEDVITFCEDIWQGGGAILSGPGGGRYVYDMRKRFNLFCKLNPLRPYVELANAGRIKPQYLAGVDIMVVRENIAGVYQGQWGRHTEADGGRRASHQFEYTDSVVTRIVTVAARLASRRSGKLAIVVKPNGVPTISELWLECGATVAEQFHIEVSPLEVDYAAYCMIQDAQAFDVIVTPNLFGDILADIGGVLLGSRGLCYSGSFSAEGRAVYQTNHGAAHDLAGSGRANPVGQILSIALLLRESFGLIRESTLIEQSVRYVWREGWRTADLLESGCRLCGTRDMASRIGDAAAALATTGK